MTATENPSARSSSNPSLITADQNLKDDDAGNDGKTERSKQAQLSIALKRDTSGKTKVIAKGSGELAEQILQIAFDQGVKVRADSDLAEILTTVDVESEIPLEALTAVATILNYVYSEQKFPNDESTPRHDIIY